jgi:hypothetical protein
MSVFAELVIAIAAEERRSNHRIIRFSEREVGGAFDGRSVSSDAEGGM